MTDERQKKTTEEYRSNWDNIFKRNSTASAVTMIVTKGAIALTETELKMKTRQELILDFMMALASNSAMTPKDGFSDKIKARDIFLLSAELTEKYLAILDGRSQ